MGTQPADDFVAVAEVVKAVGLRGELKLYPLVDWHEPLLDTEFLMWSDGAPLRLQAARAGGSRVIVRLPGCDTREQAEAIVGRLVGFRRESYLDPGFPRPPGGLPFRFLGRSVVTAAGDVVGRVSEVRRYATQILLVVKRGDGGEALVPAVTPILREDNGLEGPLVIDPPPGLLDDAGD